MVPPAFLLSCPAFVVKLTSQHCTACNQGGGFGHVVIASNTPIRMLTNNFSVALWVNPDELVPDTDQVFIGNPQEGVGWVVSAFGERLKFTTWSVQDYISSGSALSNGVWTHVAVTINEGNDVQFYVDGQPFEALKPGNSPANFGLLDTFLGTAGYDTYPYFGILDEVRVYNGVLTPAEVNALAAIPEPAIAVLATAGLLCFLRRRRIG